MTRRRVYLGPQGELQRVTYAALRPGTRYRLPSHIEDGPRRRVLEKLLQRGLIERVQDRPHLVIRRPRDRGRRC